MAQQKIPYSQKRRAEYIPQTGDIDE